MARALLTRACRALGLAALGLAAFVPAARAQDVSGRPLLPDQFIGILIRFGGGGFLGPGASNTTQPIFSYGGSLQIRILQSLYLDLAGDSLAPVASDPPSGGFLLAVDQQTAGLRFRGEGKVRPLGGLGAGGVRMRKIDPETGKSLGGSGGATAYAFGGAEWEIFGTAASAGYVGAEAVYHQYFMGTDAPFKGGSAEARITFSYYFGGEDASDCW